MLPLADVLVVSIEQYGAGPFATMQLADLGADVIKIEDPRVGGDSARYVPPYAEGESSLFFESFNRNKRSMTLDLRHPDGREVLEDLVRHADALTSNLRGDQPAKLRLRYEDFAEINPRLIVVSLSAFGTDGPRANQGGYDFTVQGIAGWMELTGGPDQPPTKSGLSLVDFCSGYVTALAVVAGVWQARRDGHGFDVDLSLFETAIAQLTYVGTWAATMGFRPPRLADSAHLSMVPFQTFPTADDPIVVSCPKDGLWRRLCSVLDIPEAADDPRFASYEARSEHREELVGLISDELRKDSSARWLDRLEHAGVPCGAVNDVATALDDAQVHARGLIASYDHPVFGEVRTPASPFRWQNKTRLPVRRGPLLGEHTREVLRDVCGYEEERINRLTADDVFGRYDSEPAA